MPPTQLPFYQDPALQADAQLVRAGPLDPRVGRMGPGAGRGAWAQVQDARLACCHMPHPPQAIAHAAEEHAQLLAEAQAAALKAQLASRTATSAAKVSRKALGLSSGAKQLVNGLLGPPMPPFQAAAALCCCPAAAVCARKTDHDATDLCQPAALQSGRDAQKLNMMENLMGSLRMRLEGMAAAMREAGTPGSTGGGGTREHRGGANSAVSAMGAVHA